MIHIENVSLSPVKTAIQNFKTTVKKMVSFKGENNNQSSEKDDKFQHTGTEPLSTEERRQAAVRKFNGENEKKHDIITNLCAENNDYKLLQEYTAYRNPEFKDLVFTPVSENKVTTTYKRKPVEIEFNILDDGNKTYEINFHDGSKIRYVIFSEGGEKKINGEEFEMPAGTIVETRTIDDKVEFSELIQTPDMQRQVINLPEGLDKAEEALKAFTPSETSSAAIMPTTEYMLNILGKANSVRTLSELSKNTSLNTPKSITDEIIYLEKSIAEGKLPQNTTITGVKEDGRKILTIPGENCKYEVCGSEMRVIDNNGEIKLIARYESGRESNGLWVISYDNGRPNSGSHYTSWDLDKPLSTVNFTYNDDNTLTTTTIDSQGNKNSIRQVLPENLCLEIDKGFKFVSSDKSHLGLIFEDQKPFV